MRCSELITAFITGGIGYVAIELVYRGSRIFVRVGCQHSARPFRMGLFQHEAQPLRANLPPLFLFLGVVDSTRFAVEQVAASSCASLFVIVILQAVSVSEKAKNMAFRENAD